MYRLLFEDRGLPRPPFESRERLVLVGRDAACTVRLSASGVDDRHATIERRADGYYVSDLGSANGVLVNGQRVSSQRLRSGDALELGSVRLRFEFVHESPPSCRRLDALQIAASVVVAALIVGETALLARMFSEPRSRAMRLEASKTLRQQQEIPAASAPETSHPLAPRSDVGASPAGPTAAPPNVLNRMLKIARVDRSDAVDSVALQVQIKAQVGERELDTAAAAISVQFFTASDGVKTVWLNVPPGWDNFTTRTLSARFFGSPQQLRGYVVRTFYRKQLQDAAAAPPSLLTTAPSPTR